MKRLIDAISLEKRIYDERKVFFIDDHKELLSKDDIYVIIKDEPPIDAVEVVRCRDCLNCGMKASIKFDGYRDDARLCMVQRAVVLPDDYCSRGVKMDAEVEG